MNWLTIVLMLFLLLSIVSGWKRGFIKMIISFLATIVTIAVVIIATPYIKSWVHDHTTVYEKIEQSVDKFVKQNAQNAVDSLEDQTAVSAGSEQEQAAVIEKLALPETLKNILIQNNSAENYEKMQVSNFSDYIGGSLANIIFSILIYIVTFLIVWILLRIFFSVLSGIGELPIIHGFNAIAGGALGLAIGLILIWIGFMIVTAASASEFGIRALQLINESSVLTFLYNHNLLLTTISSVMRSVSFSIMG